MSDSIFPRRKEPTVHEPKTPQRLSVAPEVLVVRSGAPPSTKRASYIVCYQTHLPAARAISASEVSVFTGNPRLALTNVCFGLDNVCTDPAEVARHLPLLPMDEVLAVADTARALVYATTRLPGKAASPQEIAARIGSIKKPRAQMLATAVTLAERGHLPADVVAGIKAQGGLPAMAAGAVRLCALYTENAETVRGMHPFTEKEIHDLGADGEWLLEHIKPAKARKRTASRAKTPADDRDRLGELLVRRHAMLRKIGYYFHGEDVDSFVPPLLSSLRHATVEDDPENDAPPDTNETDE